jgi:hypothetical protein
MHSGARLAVLFLGLWVGVTAAESLLPPPPEPGPEVAALAAAQSTVTTLSGDFTWMTENSSGGIQEKVGIFNLQRGIEGAPSKYNVKISEADHSDIHRWCSDGITHWAIEQMVEDEPPTVRVVKPGTQDLDLERIVACILLDVPRLSREFFMTLETTAAGRTLLFVPATAELKEQLTRIAVLLKGDEPQEVIIEDAHSARIRLVITRLVANQPLAAVFFNPLPAAQP